MSMKNSNDTIWNPTSHLPICSAVPSDMVSSQKDKGRCKSFVTTWNKFFWLPHGHRVVFDSEHKNTWNLESLVYFMVLRAYFPGIQPDRPEKKHTNLGQDGITTLHRFQAHTRNLGAPSTPTLGHTQPAVQWVRRFSPWMQGSRGVKLTTHTHTPSAEIKNT
jgi:hypothetical protein